MKIKLGNKVKDYRGTARGFYIVFKRYRIGFGYVFQKAKPIFYFNSVYHDFLLGTSSKIHHFNVIRFRHFALCLSVSIACKISCTN